jgi:hypothetical protein
MKTMRKGTKFVVTMRVPAFREPVSDSLLPSSMIAIPRFLLRRALAESWFLPQVSSIPKCIANPTPECVGASVVLYRKGVTKGKIVHERIL